MTISEKIKLYRNQSGISQEEMAQRLLVDVQTLNLWESGQTVPDYNQLVYINQTLGISVDEFIGNNFNTQPQTQPQQPMQCEQYMFTYTVQEALEIGNALDKETFKSMIYFILASIIVILALVLVGVPAIFIGILLGVAGTIIALCAHAYILQKKSWKNTAPIMAQCCYKYEIYNNYFIMDIYRNNQFSKKLRVDFSEIINIKDLGKYFAFYSQGGQMFVIKKLEINPYSPFYNYLDKNPAKKVIKTH